MTLVEYLLLELNENADFADSKNQIIRLIDENALKIILMPQNFFNYHNNDIFYESIH
jgi:hypothetical protein